MTKSKIEVLKMFWEKNLSQMSIKAMTKKDRNSQKMLNQLLAFDPELRDAFLKRYLTQCKLKHSIAFF